MVRKGFPGNSFSLVVSVDRARLGAMGGHYNHQVSKGIDRFPDYSWIAVYNLPSLRASN
jgi:hypothetical protein